MNTGRRWLLSTVVALWATGATQPARASDPTLARYSTDGSRVFWFVQLTDTHIDSVYYAREEEKLRWALGEGMEIVMPSFVVVTGDLTDSTKGAMYGMGPDVDEWQRYRAIVEESGMTTDFYYDLPGNHDAYNDGELTYYLEWSLQGAATGKTSTTWTRQFPFGRYVFHGVPSPANNGRQWPADDEEFTAPEIQNAVSVFQSAADAHLTMVFSHHDYDEAIGSDQLVQAMMEGGVGHYIYGHHHDLKIRPDVADGIMRYRTGSLGQGNSSNFTVWAIDSDTVTFATTDAENPWPLIVPTAPAAGRWGDIQDFFVPPVPGRCTSAPVRALVFDSQDVTTVRFRFDQGAWSPMEPFDAVHGQWRGVFDATQITPGWHALEIEATGSEVKSQIVDVEVVAVECTLEPQVQTDGGVILDGGDSSDASAPVDGGVVQTNDGGTFTDANGADASQLDASEGDGSTPSDASSQDDSSLVLKDAAIADDANVREDGGIGELVADAAVTEPGEDPSVEGESCGCSMALTSFAQIPWALVALLLPVWRRRTRNAKQ